MRENGVEGEDEVVLLLTDRGETGMARAIDAVRFDEVQAIQAFDDASGGQRQT